MSPSEPVHIHPSLPAVTRRRALGIAALASGLLASHTLGAPAAAAAGTPPALPPLPLLSPFPDDAVRLADFAPHEQRIARHLKSLVDLANSVEDEDPATYGFITGDFWRTPINEPFNARVQENALTLAYFLTADRPWNPVHGDPALLARLEAVLRYWISLQNDNGSFAEGKPGESSTAATGFSLRLFGEMVVRVRPPIAEDLRAEVVATLRRAADWFLDPGNDIVWVERIAYSNQVVGGMAGAAKLLPVFDDPALTRRLQERTRYLERNMQSPAGYYYENDEVDHGYSFGVMAADMALLYEAVDAAPVLRMHRRYLDWAGYNQLWEPDGDGMFVNNAISGRTGGFARERDALEGIGTLWARHLPAARAFLATKEELAVKRAEFAEGTFAELEPLAEGQMGPEPVEATGYPERSPSAAQREEAKAELPYRARSRFTEYREDVKNGQDFVFVRRPEFYLGMSFGKRSTATGMTYPSHRRGGPGFLWHPAMGTVVYSTNGDKGLNEQVWSTVRTLDGQEQVDAADSITATYLSAASGRPLDPHRIRAGQDFTVAYSPEAGWAAKRLTVEDTGVDIETEVEGTFLERIPLALLPSDALTWTGSTAPDPRPGSSVTDVEATGLTIRRRTHRLHIEWRGQPDVRASLTASDRTALTRRPRTLHTLTLHTTNTLRYRIEPR